MERFDVSPIKINHLAFKLSKSGAHVIDNLDQLPDCLPFKLN